MMEHGENLEDYVERRITEALGKHRVTDLQQLPLAALRRWTEQADDFDGDTLVNKNSIGPASLAQIPHVYANRAAAQLVANGTVTAVTLPSEGYDLGTPSEQHSTSVNTDRLLCHVTGLYSVIGFVQWASNGAGTRNIRIDVNGGGGGVYELDARGANGADETRHGGVLQLRLTAGDYINLAAFQTSGGNLNINVARLSWAWQSN